MSTLSTLDPQSILTPQMYYRDPCGFIEKVKASCLNDPRLLEQVSPIFKCNLYHRLLRAKRCCGNSIWYYPGDQSVLTQEEEIILFPPARVSEIMYYMRTSEKLGSSPYEDVMTYLSYLMNLLNLTKVQETRLLIARDFFETIVSNRSIIPDERLQSYQRILLEICHFFPQGRTYYNSLFPSTSVKRSGNREEEGYGKKRREG